MTNPKLQDLDPYAVAVDVERAVLDRIMSLGLELGPGITVAFTGDAGTRESGPSTTIGCSVRDLVAYAQTGRPKGRRPWRKYARSMIPLHSTPLAGGIAPDATTPLGVAMVAAQGRNLLEGGAPLEAKHIYTLAGISKMRFSQLLDRGDVPDPRDYGRPAKWAAKAARRWLAERGVPGL